MKTRRRQRQSLVGSVLVWLAFSAWGQGAPERIAVKLTDPSRPGTVKASVLNGSIIVKGYDGKEVVVETNQRGLEVTEEGNEVTAKQPGAVGSVDLRLSVPAKTSLQLKCTTGGNIRVENVEGEIEVNGLNASLTLRKVAGVVVAHSLQGRVTVQLDKVAPGKPMSFSSMNGDVEVALPPNTKADVKLQTVNGAIHSDFAIRSGPDLELEPGKRLAGKLSGGGPEIQLKTLNGSIYLKKLEQRTP